MFNSQQKSTLSYLKAFPTYMFVNKTKTKLTTILATILFLSTDNNLPMASFIIKSFLNFFLFPSQNEFSTSPKMFIIFTPFFTTFLLLLRFILPLWGDVLTASPVDANNPQNIKKKPTLSYSDTFKRLSHCTSIFHSYTFNSL